MRTSVAWAEAESAQNSGWAVSASRRAISCSRPGMSKTHRQVLNSAEKLFELVYGFSHGYRASGLRAEKAGPS
jgi:hypothetical protein